MSEPLKRQMREVPVTLSAQECAERGKRLAHVRDQVREREEEFAQLKQAHKAEVALLENEASKLLEALRTGQERQKREVEVLKDFARNRVVYLLDGKEVDERVMESLERQMEMDGEPPHDEEHEPPPKPDHKMLAANDDSAKEEGPIL